MLYHNINHISSFQDTLRYVSLKHHAQYIIYMIYILYICIMYAACICLSTWHAADHARIWGSQAHKMQVHHLQLQRG